IRGNRHDIAATTLPGSSRCSWLDGAADHAHLDASGRAARVHRGNGARPEEGVWPDMLLDNASRRITVRAGLAADFNSTLAKGCVRR
ncbi:hypothetical protein, partial [Achromobacter sp.]|uniref:hypothetical protein n=1 Tax=Achromobacter sp. TaxID=134375 RepID=UPI0028A8DA6C